ncbi:MAG: shikimate kinase [Lachnospiraceae bacterium]|nr:shikimate kinase [Lachnospiraceae bacterium]
MGNVILIGFMGCGKTTVGLKLSYRLRRAVIDTDKEIEKEEKRAISDIFFTDGEEYFRDRETACLRKMLGSVNNQIISVGGGLPLREENRRLLHELGQVFYLRANAETIYERVRHDTTRPLLQGGDPKGKIRMLLSQRDGCYAEAADVVIDVNDKDFEQILCEIEAHVHGAE